MRAAGAIARALLRRLAQRRWLQIGAGAGLAALAVVAVAATGDADAAARDELRRGAAGLLLLGGLAAALGIGSSSLNTDSDNGHHGLLVGAGIGRPRLVAEVLAARVIALGVVVAAWGVFAQAMSLALGLGLDGPLAVHTLATSETLALVLLAAGATSSVVGRVAGGVGGAAIFVVAQAVVNLKAAADDGVIGTAGDGISAVYAILPRAITSPMIAGLQARDAAGIAAPQIDINRNIVTVPASSAGTVGWTLLWCAIFVLLAIAGMRRRVI